MIFFDTETCGLHGPIVLLQYAEDDGEIKLHSVWEEPVGSTLELIENIVNHEGGVCGFNLAFDWFHICQLYTTLNLFPDADIYPTDHIEEYVKHEAEAWAGPCLKPIHALDIMLHARKGPYQSTMNRKNIVIKRIPTALAFKLADELDARIQLNDVYFAKKQNPRKRWQVDDIIDEFGEIVPDFKNIVLRFAPSSSLKALYEDVFNIKATHFWEVSLPSKAMPKEYGYAPYALAVSDGGWPQFIKTHISHWSYNKIARQYASDDVMMTRALYEHFGRPPVDDDDSILACMVGAIRWHGFRLDLEKIRMLLDENNKAIAACPFNPDAPKSCLHYVMEKLTDSERMVLVVDGHVTTKAVVLETIAKWTQDEVCPNCKGQGCKNCVDGLVKTTNPHPAAERAREILDARHAIKENQLFEKLLRAKRFFPSFSVIGTKSSRMAGADSLNPQGIKRATHVRTCFPLADPGYVLTGGDYEAQEISILVAAYRDPILESELSGGKKIHALWGMFFFPGLTYEQIMKSKGAANPWEDYYTRSKNGVFALCYFGEDYTLVNRVGLDEEVAHRAYESIWQKYTVMGAKRRKVVEQFCSMRQPGGIGSRVEWHEPAEYIESMLGFRRYFTLENKICKALFDLANKVPKDWQDIKIKVIRRDREQLASGAVQSALYAAAFSLQAQNMRAAGNHIIQSTGAGITKKHQVKLWQMQPTGIHPWVVLPLNIHDEIMAPTLPERAEETGLIAKEMIAETKPIIPLIAIDWKTNIPTWGHK